MTSSPARTTTRGRLLLPLLLLALLLTGSALPAYGAAPVPEPQSIVAPPRQRPDTAVAARVTRVVDGDTIVVRIRGQSYRVRYIGMDTPERGNPCFEDATDANAAWVEGRTIYLEKDVREVDRYGRLLRNIWTADGVLVNEALVREGYAAVFTFPPDVKYESRLIDAQRAARADGAGCLWGD